MSDTCEVYALLDRADELSTRDASVSGRMLLGLTVALMLASGLAEEGPPPVGLELPGTLGECIVAAADKVARWDPSMMSMPAHELSMLMPDLVDELGR